MGMPVSRGILLTRVLSLVREYLAAWRASGRELPNRLRCDNDLLKEVERKAIERDFPGVLIEYSNPYEHSSRTVVRRRIFRVYLLHISLTTLFRD